MRGRRRILGLTALALAVPAFALGGESQPGPPALGVTASLGGCGLAEAQISCRIDVGWDSPEGADYFTVSVTRPDGSVVDLGQSTGTGRSVYVGYVGPGTYSVQVAAWGTPPGEEEPAVLAREKALSTQDESAGSVTDSPTGSRAPGGEDGARDVVDEAPATDDAATGVPAEGDLPVCEEPPEQEETDAPAEGDATEAATAAGGEATATDAAAAEEPEEPVTCP